MSSEKEAEQEKDYYWALVESAKWGGFIIAAAVVSVGMGLIWEFLIPKTPPIIPVVSAAPMALVSMLLGRALLNIAPIKVYGATLVSINVVGIIVMILSSYKPPAGSDRFLFLSIYFGLMFGLAHGLWRYFQVKKATP